MLPHLIYIQTTSVIVLRKLKNASSCVQKRGPWRTLLINNLTLKIMQSSKVNNNCCKFSESYSDPYTHNLFLLCLKVVLALENFA
jgi:hypothetical protein